ncbi:hypothetical protein AAFF_G00235640 [Aldrovandia affinis]|uniref:Uncharacterized protein n=1 Tax=Aldrovandia affinis TaxID=143900 RepID=A0AAD7SV74_9TELE|nr:hypothetical protein AAFF_G00235640 [Aldrovandia affinis]
MRLVFSGGDRAAVSRIRIGHGSGRKAGGQTDGRTEAAIAVAISMWLLPWRGLSAGVPASYGAWVSLACVNFPCQCRLVTDMAGTSEIPVPQLCASGRARPRSLRGRRPA